MIDIKILAPPNIKYFGDLHPFRRWNKSLRNEGINVEYAFDHTDKKLLTADHVIIHHRYFERGWVGALDTATDPGSDFIKYLINLKDRAGKVIWFDAGDSSGTTQFPVIPYVDLFVKKQVLKNRDYYTGNPQEPKNLMVWADQKVVQKQFIPCPPEQLHKIKVGWNVAFNDYRDFMVHYHIRKYLSHFVNYQLLPIKYTKVDAARPFDITFRGTINYANPMQKLISEQRNKTLELFRNLPYNIASGGNVHRNKYLNEMSKSRLTVSPFGYGEVCFRDFETFIAGSLLIKPSMCHLDTSPDLFIPHETYVPVSWDMSDLKDTLDNVLSNYSSYRQIALNGQELYKKTVDRPESFMNSLKRIISE